MSGNLSVSITEEEKNYDKSEYFSGSQILNHDYQDKLTNIFINSHCSLSGGERTNLANNIHQVRKIFSEHTDNNIYSMWIGVFDIGKLDTDEFKEREIKSSKEKYWKNSIHVRSGDVQDKVLVYSWLDINQFNQDKWNNLLSQLEKDHKVDFIGTGPLTFKYKDFNYRVYPPLFGSSDDKKSFLNDTEVFSFSPTGISQIIEDIKESHQSIKKKIASYYESLGKDFAENNKGYIEIKAGIDENNVKNFTNVSYTNKSDDINNNQIEEAFIKEEERNNVGNLLHLAVYTNSKNLMEQLLDATDVNEVNKNDRTPLHLAAKYGREDMVEMLLNKEAKVDVVDNRGRTPLHLAAQYNEKKEIVEMLLNKGAKVDIADNRGRTPLHLACIL
ncbi:MAG: ankyrin repeat domain-containing protein [Wolbachia sp.]